MGYQYQVKSDKDTHFAGGLAQNAGEDESLTMPGALAGINGDCKNQLKSLTIISDQNLDWEIMVWSSATHGVADLDTNQFIGRWTFAATDAVQVAGTGSYYYYIDGLDVSYADADYSGKLHLTLINRSATAKNAGATGEVVVKARLAPPVFGWSGS